MLSSIIFISTEDSQFYCKSSSITSLLFNHKHDILIDTQR